MVAGAVWSGQPHGRGRAHPSRTGSDEKGSLRQACTASRDGAIGAPTRGGPSRDRCSSSTSGPRRRDRIDPTPAASPCPQRDQSDPAMAPHGGSTVNRRVRVGATARGQPRSGPCGAFRRSRRRKRCAGSTVFPAAVAHGRSSGIARKAAYRSEKQCGRSTVFRNAEPGTRRGGPRAVALCSRSAAEL